MTGIDASRIVSAAGALGVASMAVFGTTAWDEPPRQSAESTVTDDAPDAAEAPDDEELDG